MSLLFKKFTNSRIHRIKKAKFSGYFFYMNRNIWEDFQMCISVPLSISSERETESFCSSFCNVPKNDVSISQHFLGHSKVA